MGTRPQQGKVLALSVDVDQGFGDFAQQTEADGTAVYPANVTAVHPQFPRQQHFIPGLIFQTLRFQQWQNRRLQFRR